MTAVDLMALTVDWELVVWCPHPEQVVPWRSVWAEEDVVSFVLEELADVRLLEER